jgi:hypothetical protein
MENSGTVSLQIFDAKTNPTVNDNLEVLVRKLNSMNLGARFVSKGYQSKYYLQEIQEFVLLVSDKHILTNENKFKLAKTFSSDTEFEDVARYFLKCLEVGCGLHC